MDEESTETPAGLEKTDPKGSEVRKYSTEEEISPKSGIKVLSRYLRARVHSCHDNCKYGLNHPLEEKPESPVLKKPAKSAGHKGQDLKKKHEFSPKFSPKYGTRKPDDPGNLLNEELSSKNEGGVSSENILSPLKEIHVSAVHSLTPKKLKSMQSMPSSLKSMRSIPSSLLGGKSSLSCQASSEFRNSKEELGTSIIDDKKAPVKLPKEKGLSSEKVLSPCKVTEVSPVRSSTIKKLNSTLSMPSSHKSMRSIPSSLLGGKSSLSLQTSSEFRNSMEELGTSIIDDKKALVKPRKEKGVSSEKVLSPRKVTDVSPVRSSTIKELKSTLSMPSSLKAMRSMPSSLLGGKSSLSRQISSEFRNSVEELGTSIIDDKNALVKPPKEKGLSSEKVLSPSKVTEVSPVRSSTIKKLKSTLSMPSPLRGAKGCLSHQRSSEFFRGSKEEMWTSDTATEKVLVQPAVSLTPKNRNRKISNEDSRNYNNLKGMSHLKNSNSPRRVKPSQPNNEHSLPNNEEVPEKILYITEQGGENQNNGSTQSHIYTTISSLPSSLSSEENSLNHSLEEKHITQMPSHSDKKTKRRTRNSGHKQYKADNSQISLSPSSSLLSSSFMSLSGPIDSKNDGPTSRNDTKEDESSKFKRKSRLRRLAILSSEHNLPSRKLKFKRGTVIDLKEENNAPRRLKFRRVKLVGEIQNGHGEMRKRSSRKKDIAAGELLDGTSMKSEKDVLEKQNLEDIKNRRYRRKVADYDKFNNGNRIKPERIVLRHQDIKGNEEIKSLYNNVIEETASKLVQTRKSKVKALVGAFETVISLQDTKPSGITSA